MHKLLCMIHKDFSVPSTEGKHCYKRATSSVFRISMYLHFNKLFYEVLK